MKKVRTKLCLLPKISGVEVAPCLLPKIFGVKVTPSVTSVESSEQFWRKIRQIWRICEPCSKLTKCNESPGLTISLCTVLAETHSPVIAELYYSSYTEKMML